MPIFQENTSNPIRGILVIALLWLSTGAMHLYSQVPSYVPTNGLVGWWPFNGNANDESGNGNNFNIYGPSLTSNRFATPSSAYSFNGSQSSAEILQLTPVPTSIASAHSTSLWFTTSQFYPNQQPSNPYDFNNFNLQGLISINSNNWNIGPALNYRLNFDNSKISTEHWTASGAGGGVESTSIISTNQWYHLTVVYDGTTSTSYLNGNQIMSFNTSFSLSNQIDLVVGGLRNGPSMVAMGGFKGIIDDIGFWNRALTQSEISALYSAQSSTPCTATIITQDTTICAGASVTLRAPALTTTTVPSAGNCSNGIGTWEQLFTSAQLSGYSINRTNGYAFDTATGIYYSVSGATTLKVDLVNKTIAPFTQSGQNSSFSFGIFNYSDQKLYAHRVGRDVVYQVPKAGGAWTVFGAGSFDANSYGSQPFYDAQNNRIGFFGGYGFYSVKNWVYESTSTGWVNPYANNNNCNPARRNATGIAPSKDYKKMFIFSGAGNCNGSQTATSCTLGQAWASDVGKWCWLQDLYEYDFATNSFTTILPTASPSISQEGSFAYNYDEDAFYILGGFTPPATYSATWGNTTPYTNTVLMMDRGAGATSFTQASVCGTPPPVGTVNSSQGMAFYDGPRDRVIWMRPDGIWALNLNTSTTSTTSSRLWSTGDTSQTTTVTPNQTTNYILTITQNGVSCNDTVTIYVNNPSINSSQTALCQSGDSVLLWTPNANHQVATPACSTSYVGILPTYVAGQSIPGYTYSGTSNGHYYYKANNPGSWLDAANSAKNAGGHLVCIDDATEQTFVQNLSTSNMWIGYYRTSNTDPWKWVNCQNTTYTNWRSGEPGNNEHYTHILTNACFGPDQWNNLGNISTNGVCYSNCLGILEIDPNLNIAPSNIQTLSWSTGQTGDSIWVTPNGTTTYAVTSVLNGVTCTDSITISVSGAHISASDTVVCAGSPVTLTAGGSVQFNGSSGFISFPNAGPTGQSPRSFSMWFKTNSTSEMDLLGYGTRSCTQALELKLNDNLNYSASYNNNPCTLLQGVSTNFDCHGSNWSANVSDDQWHHVVYVLGENGNYSYSNIKAYLDGVLISANPGCFHNWGGWTYNTSAASPMVIGKPFDGNQHFFNGTIDEVSIWNSALNSSQVGGIYQNGVVPTDPNLAHYYDFNDVANGQVPDLVGSNNGTIQGGAWQSALQAGTGTRSFLWSTGDTTPSITVNPTQTATYWLTTTSHGISCSDSIQIHVVDVGLQYSTNFVCEPGDSVLIWTNSNAQNLTSNTCFPPGATLNNGLLAWYPFCGNANDASGNGNHAQVFGATMASDRFGTPQSAYDFDGIDDHLRAAVTNLPKGNSARSFAGWIYSDGANANGGSGTIYHHGAISYRQRDCMLQWNNQTFSHIGEGYDFGGGSLPQGSWQHVAFTHDGTTARLYVNGALRAQSNRNYNTAVGDLFLGFNSNSGHFNGERFNGRIDDFGAWNRVLSAQEIQLLVTNAVNQTLWSNGSTNDSIWVTPTQTTTYSVQKTAMGQTCTDSVTIFVASARIQASDTAICSGGSTTLTASYNGLGQTYLWSTGDTTSQIIVAPVTTSIYSLTTTLSNGLQCVDSVRIHVNNAQITASDTVICSAGDSVLLWVPYQNAGIIPGSWGTGQSSFYSTNFNSGIDPGWSSPTGPMPYSGNRVGPFGAGTLQLNLNNLPCHDSLRFNGILQLTGTWDGNGNHCCGPDIFNIIVDGSTVFSTTFTLTQWAGNFQSYPSQYNPSNLVNNAQGTGSIANNTYLLSFNFPHTSGAIEFKLAQPASQGAADEAWYFDDFNLELFECGAGGSSIWSTGQGGDSIWVKPQQTTKYWVKRWMQGIVCSDTITVHVSNLQQNFDPLPDTLVVCNGLSTLVHVGPGFTSYQWNDATTDSVKTINATGTYWVTVTDSLGCQASDTIWVYFSDLGASITKLNDVFCFGGNNGAISLTTFGGQPPYSITWSTGQTGISGLANLGAGVYWVTVTDALGCLRRDTIAVGQPIAPLSVIVAVNNVSCFAGATGSLTSVVSGGTAPYTYSWNTVPAQTSPTASNLPAGSYTLFITDANGCNLTVSGVITQPAAPLSASVSGTNVLCFGGTTGTANVVASGGTAPYSYSWNTSPAQTTSAATNLASGTYTVTIIDSKNCQTTQSVTITQPSAPLSGTISTTTVNCYGGSNGSATVTPSGGTGPYNFIWTTVPAQTSATASNLPAGTHTVLITDANNCSVTRTATVTQPASALAVTSTFTPVLCFGDATGTATVLATGGTAPYSYQWTSIPGLTSNSATNLSVGAYVVVVTDAKGCTQQASIAVTQPSAPLSGTLSVTDVACFGNATGSITANINGGTAPYSYSWSSIPGLTSNSASGLTAGTYAVSATDANGCTYSLSGTIAQPLAPLQATSSGQDALCFGAASGFAQVAPSGGTAPYSFNWNTVPAQTTPVASNLTAGTYTCTVTDANGCVQFGVWTVGQPMPLMGTSVVNDVSCGRAQDGSIQVSISGGTGNYSISWPNGSNSLNRYQLGPGTYSYTITDENNCSFIGTATVNEPDPFRVTVDTVSPKCNSTEDGRITITATGGNGMLTYYINGEVFNGMADGLGVFPYGITIMDQNGCDTSFVVDLSPVYEPCVEIPNWFSPNGNGENDLWVIQGFELEALKLVVFNVWGQIIYQTDSDNYIPWDGTYEGVSLPNGDYYYVMTSRNEHKYYSGYVTILR